MTHSGLITIVGRPNVGKSTLMNRLIGTRLSIVAHKAQTTRRRIQGILTEDEAQMVFVDTPGLQYSPEGALGRYMNREVFSALEGVDLVVLLLSGARVTKMDEQLLSLLSERKGKVIVVLNKSDTIADSELIKSGARVKAVFDEGVADLVELLPLSALKGRNVALLKDILRSHLPQAPFLYDKDQLSNMNEQFLTGEFLREQLVQVLAKELPYSSDVKVDRIRESETLIEIDAYIICERRGQKAIILGKEGLMLKALSSKARKNMEYFLKKKVMLRVWVKVMADWTQSEKGLKSLGYD